jgi:hypothetical protein
MPHLNKFTFKIETLVRCKNETIALSSNEDIQRSFTGRIYGRIYSDVESLSRKGQSRCRIYSLPYQFEDFLNLNKSFQGGVFHSVRCLMMFDKRPFEYDLFKVISQDFPYLVQLYITNDKPQKEKQQLSTRIIFPHLIFLQICCFSHVNYAEQFLVDKKCHLPRLLSFVIRYELLTMVTNNFTNDATRLTCANLTSLTTQEPFVRPENFDQYFPLLSNITFI